jgi:hypothetical protein
MDEVSLLETLKAGVMTRSFVHWLESGWCVATCTPLNPSTYVHATWQLWGPSASLPLATNIKLLGFEYLIFMVNTYGHCNIVVYEVNTFNNLGVGFQTGSILKKLQNRGVQLMWSKKIGYMEIMLDYRSSLAAWAHSAW